MPGTYFICCQCSLSKDAIKSNSAFLQMWNCIECIKWTLHWMWFKEWTWCNNLFCLKKKHSKPRALFSVPKGKLQHYHCCIPFLLPFHCSCLSRWFLFLAFVILGFAISSWKKTQEYQNSTLRSVARKKKKSECSVKKLKKNIFTIFNSHLHSPHQINSVFLLHPICQRMTLMQGETPPRQCFVFLFLEKKKQHDRNNSALNFFCILHSQMSSPRGNWY